MAFLLFLIKLNKRQSCQYRSIKHPKTTTTSIKMKMKSRLTKISLGIIVVTKSLKVLTMIKKVPKK